MDLLLLCHINTQYKTFLLHIHIPVHLHKSLGVLCQEGWLQRKSLCQPLPNMGAVKRSNY